MPVFNAVSNSAKQLHLLLRCINFGAKAQVQLTPEGMRVSVEEARTMQGLVFLDKSLFTSYHFLMEKPPPSTANSSTTTDSSQEPPIATFQISLPALLETLQIFSSFDPKDRWASGSHSTYSSGIERPSASSAFDTRLLGLSGSCRLSYNSTGDALRVVMAEAGVTTTCRLVAYAPEDGSEIPFDREALAHKIIMRAGWLYDAVTELASAEPERLTLLASPEAPYFALKAVGPLGSATVAFSRDETAGDDAGQGQLLETFQVRRRVVNTYRFALFKAATRAMAVATKVSIRSDDQGVLSLQFLIEVEGGNVTFVDFRFVPDLPEAEGDAGGGDEDGSEADAA